MLIVGVMKGPVSYPLVCMKRHCNRNDLSNTINMRECTMAEIYVVEDDTDIQEIETIALKNSGHSVSGFSNGKDFFRAVADKTPDLVLLDIMLPDMDGYEILKKLRQNELTSHVPVIMVTAKTAEIDMIKGLDIGADDYIRKPFSVMELITRVKALLRRAQGEQVRPMLRLGSIFLDSSRRVVTVDDHNIELTYKEFELLRLLMSNPGIVLTREVIMQRVWDTNFEGESRTVDMHIKTLRQKLGTSADHIKTVRNVGYVME